MSELRITPTRLDLLRAVGRGEVERDRNFPYEARRYDGRRRKVTVAMEALGVAGLVELDHTDQSSRWVIRFKLTRHGRAVVEAHQHTTG